MSYQQRYETLPPSWSVSNLAPLTFSKDDVKDAPLTCSTKIDIKNFDFGFTAKDIFYRSESLNVHQLTFFHDQSRIEILTSFNGGKKLKMEVKYSSFCNLNFELNKRNAFDEIVNSKMTINIIHPPLFFEEKKQKGGWMKFVRANPIDNNIDKLYWKKFIQSTAFQLSFNLPASEMPGFINQFYENSPCAITFIPMKITAFDSLGLRDLNEFIQKWSWDVQYDIECIKSCGTKGTYFLNYVLYEEQRKDDLITEENARELFAAMYDHLQMNPSLSSLDFEETHIEKPRDLGENFVLVKTVYVTPTRYLATREAWTMDSRGLRYVGIDNLIQIKFRDENLSWFPYELADITITPTCRAGIIIADKLFFEFGGSNSLFRECGTYFCNAKSKREVLSMYNQLGEFEPATAAKLSARLGLYFTSAWKLRLQLKQKNVAVIDDILSLTKDSAGNHYCFTDGNGLMSYAFAKHITQELGIPYFPSAFQFRYAGYKGMLSVAPKNSKDSDCPYYRQLIDNDGPYFVLFRKSQKKFHVKGEDKELDFDIVQWSAPAPFNLYRTFIAILDYLAYKDGKQKIVRDRLRELNNSACYDIIKPLIDDRAFRNKLEELPSYCPISKMEKKNLMDEKFWRSMVEASVVADAKMLAIKTQLPLPFNLGRTAFGVADHTGKLKENEVFFQYSKTLSTKSCNKDPVIKIGKVGVTRSPIYHPGDIRFLTAVDIPELHHFVDVLVFPTVGDRPIPDECGGGDLDGDAYSIFWDEALMLNKNFPATDFADHDSHKAKKITLNELQEEHPEFRAEYQKNRNIEPLSNSFLTILLTQDPESQECKLMRKCADIAVNYPKSGIFNRAMNDDERHNFWPAFMCKEHEPAFKTSHILCELHEKSNAWYQQIRIATKEAEKERSEKVVKILPKEFCIIKNYFDSFKIDIQKIMIKHQIQTEGELYSNSFTNICGALSNNKLPLINESEGTSIVQKQVHHIFKKYRSWLLGYFSNDWKSDMEEKRDNIFTYKLPKVTHEMTEFVKEMYAMSEENNCCYAFPWLLWEGLDAKTDGENKQIFSAAKKIDSDCQALGNPSLALFETLSLTPNLKIAFESMNITWLWEYSKLCKAWISAFNLDEVKYVSFFQNYFIELLKEMIYKDIPFVKSSGDAFLRFLDSQMQKDFDTSESNDFQKAIQKTLVDLAFLPERNIFTRNNYGQSIIEQKCIVISVPKNWASEFEENYKILKDNSGCEDLSIGVRRNVKDSVYYSVMFRGSLESGEKLKKMLTPVISLRMQHSMKDTKKRIADEMNNLLKGIFNFQQPLDHSKNAPSQTSDHPSSSRWRTKRTKKNKTASQNFFK